MFWKEEEVKFLHDNFEMMEHKEICRRLGRNLGGMRSKGYSLGLKKPKTPIEEHVNSMSISERAYIAGLVDGEGTISLHFRRSKSKYHERTNVEFLVQICNTDIPLLEKIKEIVGCGNLQCGRSGKKGLKNAMNFRICNRMAVREFLLQIREYLILKRKHADLVLDFMEQHKFGTPLSGKDIEMIKTIYGYNYRGQERVLHIQ
jgi:hypothetical protein